MACLPPPKPVVPVATPVSWTDSVPPPPDRTSCTPSPRHGRRATARAAWLREYDRDLDLPLPTQHFKRDFLAATMDAQIDA